MRETNGPVYYGDYLQLQTLLNLQRLKSEQHGQEAHEETLFIVVHQIYELWFKQILHEMHSVQKIFCSSPVEDQNLTKAVARLERIVKIQGILVDQLNVMETMTPMDFLEFRDFLVPASGFQSVQFREIEILMGLRTDDREGVDRQYFTGRLSLHDRERITKAEKIPSLLKLTENWLERIPFTCGKNYHFWPEYEQAVHLMLSEDEEIITKNQAHLSAIELKFQMDNLQSTRETFQQLFDPIKHQSLIDEKKRKLSQKATLSALFILLFREEAILHLPYLYLKTLMDIDENFTTWRHRHALMAHRLLGTKIGTGGSSGHQYLKRAADNNRVYLDLFNLSTFIIPNRLRPNLPSEVKKNLGFYFTGSN